MAKPIKTSLKKGIKGIILERSNALNSAKKLADPSKTFQANVIYWGYWKPEGEKDVVEVLTPSPRLGTQISPVIKRPILGPPKSPKRPSVNTLTPASISNLGATGGTPTTQTVTDLSALTGVPLDNSIVTGIKSIFAEAPPENGDLSPYVNGLIDLYVKYPQVSKSKFLGLYDKAKALEPLCVPMLIIFLLLKNVEK